MKKKKIFMSLLATLIMVVSLSTGALASDSGASKAGTKASPSGSDVLDVHPEALLSGSADVYLVGSGPVYSKWVRSSGTIQLYIRNYNNLNVGYDVFDSKGRIVANGTITDAGNYGWNITNNGLSYRVRLRCQEPFWNNTKCNARGTLYHNP